VSDTDLVPTSIRSLERKPSQNYCNLSDCGWTDQKRLVLSKKLPFHTVGGWPGIPAHCTDLWAQTAEWHPVPLGLRITVQTDGDIWEAGAL